MTYSVSTVQPGDIPWLAEVQWAALTGNALTKVLYPRGATPALLEYTIQSYQRTATYPSAKLIKATSTATGEIVGFAKWIVYRKDDEMGLRQSISSAQKRWSESRRSSGWKRDSAHMPTMPPDCHGILLEKWGEIIHQTRKGLSGAQGHACRTGAPCSLECYFSSFDDNLWVLDIIHVIPLYHRGGIGSMLMDWGINQADKEGASCYVECSPAARPLCIKKGFQHVEEMQIELGRYKDGFEQYQHMIMLRPPKNITISERSSRHDPFVDEREGPVSPVSPIIDDLEVPYTAEARLLHFRSKSSLRSVAKLTDTRGSKRSLPLSQTPEPYRDIPAPIAKGPSSLRMLNAG